MVDARTAGEQIADLVAENAALRARLSDQSGNGEAVAQMSVGYVDQLVNGEPVIQWENADHIKAGDRIYLEQDNNMSNAEHPTPAFKRGARLAATGVGKIVLNAALASQPSNAVTIKPDYILRTYVCDFLHLLPAIEFAERDRATAEKILERIKSIIHSNDVVGAYPECSGDPASCPENEGHGCCKPNPAATVPQVVQAPNSFNVQSADFAGLQTAIKIIKSIDDGEAPEYMACIEAIQAQITTASNAGEAAPAAIDVRDAALKDAVEACNRVAGSDRDSPVVFACMECMDAIRALQSSPQTGKEVES